MSATDCLKVKGFFRIKKDEDGGIVADTGWLENTVVNLGFQDYICASIGAVAGSKQISHLAIGTGTAPATNGTSLEGETGTRKTTSNSVVASNTLQMTAAWASGDHPGGTPSVQNLGLFNTSATGTLCAGNTFSSSAWNSNQGISATYQLRFS